MKKLFIVLSLLVSTIVVHAGDICRIRNYDSLITANYSDLVTFMNLNARGNKSAIRAFYNVLERQGLLVNVQPGVLVEVVGYEDNGIDKLYIDGVTGYIADSDLVFLYSR